LFLYGYFGLSVPGDFRTGRQLLHLMDGPVGRVFSLVSPGGEFQIFQSARAPARGAPGGAWLTWGCPVLSFLLVFF
jgi:hypothetical protein